MPERTCQESKQDSEEELQQNGEQSAGQHPDEGRAAEHLAVSPLQQSLQGGFLIDRDRQSHSVGSEIRFEIGHFLIAIGRIFLQGFHAEGIKFGGNFLFWCDRGWRSEWAFRQFALNFSKALS